MLSQRTLDAIREYELALNRLKAGKPERIELGYKISKDTVALEAGRERGSIRKREGYESLMAAIDAAAEAYNKSAPSVANKIKKEKEVAEHHRSASEQAKADRDAALTAYMSTLMHAYNIETEMRRNGLEVPTVSKVYRVDVRHDGSDEASS